jgi:hypothetical protein
MHYHKSETWHKYNDTELFHVGTFVINCLENADFSQYMFERRQED